MNTPHPVQKQEQEPNTTFRSQTTPPDKHDQSRDSLLIGNIYISTSNHTSRVDLIHADRAPNIPAALEHCSHVVSVGCVRIIPALFGIYLGNAKPLEHIPPLLRGTLTCPRIFGVRRASVGPRVQESTYVIESNRPNWDLRICRTARSLQYILSKYYIDSIDIFGDFVAIQVEV